MEDQKVLVVPGYDLESSSGGPLGIANLLKSHPNSDRYFYIPERVKYETNKTSAKARELVKKQGLFRTAKKYFFKLFSFDSLSRTMLESVASKGKFETYRESIEEHKNILCMRIFLAKHIMDNYPEKNVFVAYHGQGSRYNELCNREGSRKNILAKKYCEKVERQVYNKCDGVIFPSRGSIEALTSTNPSLESIIDKNAVEIVNNCIDHEKIKKASFPHREKIDDEKIIFLTVSTLNYAKGVDRIPDKLSELREKGLDFQWILKGSGPMADAIKEKIEERDLEDRVEWFDERFTKPEMFDLFSMSDIYIILHRHSIFDLATIEAMSTSNIPLLTRTGGNIEFDRENNVIFSDELEKSIKILRKTENLEQMKKLNREIAEDYFTKDRMLEDYKNAVKKLGGKNEDSSSNP